MADRGISQELADRFQLGYTGDTGDGTAHRLAIPYLTPAGPIDIRYRCITDHECKTVGCPKYLSEEGGDPHLFNAGVLAYAQTVALPEGELDAVAGTGSGVEHVGRPGTETWSPNPSWVWCFDSCDEVIVVCDGDVRKEGKRYGAGEEAGRKVVADLRAKLPHVDSRLVVMPVGYDVNSFIQAYGEYAYLQKIGVGADAEV